MTEIVELERRLRDLDDKVREAEEWAASARTSMFADLGVNAAAKTRLDAALAARDGVRRELEGAK